MSFTLLLPPYPPRQALKLSCSVQGSDLGDLPVSRKSALAKLNEQLLNGDQISALQIVTSIQGSIDGFRAFGAARQVPFRDYTLEELKLNGIETSKFLSPVDSTLGAIKRNLQLAAVAGILVAWQAFDISQTQLLFTVVFLLFLATFDQILNGGGVEALLLDTIGRVLSQRYRDRVSQHEAGHFLVAYLVGILPESYTLSSVDALLKKGSLNVQAGTSFVDTPFQEEVKSGKLSSVTLNKYACVALAGVATEYLRFGIAEGGLSDIQQLDSLLKGLGFTQKKANSVVRWAVLNTISILRRHEQVHSELAVAMNSGKTVAECIDIIEDKLKTASDI